MATNDIERWTREQVDSLGADKGFLPAAYWPRDYQDDPKSPTETLVLAILDAYHKTRVGSPAPFILAQPAVKVALENVRLEAWDAYYLAQKEIQCSTS